jgi:hypothetical protein
MSTEALRRTDIEAFLAIGVSETATATAHLRRVTHTEARDICGICYKSTHLEGIAFPYLNPETGDIVTWRVRRDHPEVAPDGRPIAKYVSPPERRHLYFVPNCKDALADRAVTAIVVESEKSVLAIDAAERRAGRPRSLGMATGGCWGWHGITGKTTSPTGARVDEKGPLTDFDRVVWTGRDVVILFDSDVATNAQVRAGRRALAAELTRRGASVRIGELPEEEGINGPDDFVGKRGDDALLRVIDQAARRDLRDDVPAKRTSQSARLVQVARDTGAEWFHDDDQAYVRVSVSDHFETYPLRSRVGRGWLQRLFFAATEGCPSAQSMADALHSLEALALCGPDHRVHVRVAAMEDGIYIDPGDPTWQVVHISATGWRRVSDAPVRFRRPKAFMALPSAQVGGTVTALRPFVNLSDDDFVLFVAWLTAALRGRGPYPVLIVNGDEGAAKSTLARIAKALIDPQTPLLRTAPRDPRDLMIAAEHNHLLAFDNLSGLSDWLSDALCRFGDGWRLCDAHVVRKSRGRDFRCRASGRPEWHPRDRDQAGLGQPRRVPASPRHR